MRGHVHDIRSRLHARFKWPRAHAAWAIIAKSSLLTASHGLGVPLEHLVELHSIRGAFVLACMRTDEFFHASGLFVDSKRLIWRTMSRLVKAAAKVMCHFVARQLQS